MGTVQGTLRLRTVGQRWRAKFACALVITIAVGICTYALTYRALVVISTPSDGTTALVPGTPSTTLTPPTAPTAPTGVAPPGH